MEHIRIANIQKERWYLYKHIHNMYNIPICTNTCRKSNLYVSSTYYICVVHSIQKFLCNILRAWTGACIQFFRLNLEEEIEKDNNCKSMSEDTMSLAVRTEKLSKKSYPTFEEKSYILLYRKMYNFVLLTASLHYKKAL